MQGVEQAGWLHLTGIRPGERVVEAVVRAVTATRGCRPEELQPVQRVIDGDALNAFFEQTGTDPTVEFEYEGYAVQITQSAVAVTETGMA